MENPEKSALKNYEQVFTCELPVNLLAEQLLATWVDFETISDAHLEHYIRLTEAIVNSVQNNASKCADIFNAINGWVKLPVPGEEEIVSVDGNIKEQRLVDVDDSWEKTEPVDYDL